MYINIEIPNVKNLEDLVNITEAIKFEPIKHEILNCGYNTINITYKCSKTDVSRLKKHWKSSVDKCFIVTT